MKFEEKLKIIDRFTKTEKDKTNFTKKSGQLAEFLEGEVCENPYGEFLLIEKNFTGGYPHGIVRLYDLLEQDAQTLVSLGGEYSLGVLDPEKVVFLDIETTGLSGGVGTYAFLVGVGFFRKENFVIRQYFMRDYDEEKALLCSLVKELSDFQILVTFNGKCFDLPLLENRLVFHRIKNSLRELLHLDLIYPARRIWKRRLKSCALSHLESEVLFVPREEDVPSWLVPRIYFDFLQYGKIDQLTPVLSHNLYDILSLVGLLTLIGKGIKDPLTSEIKDPLDLVCLGKFHRNLRNFEESISCFSEALNQNIPTELRLEISLHLAYLYQRSQNLEKATKVWDSILSGNYPFVLSPYEELAKFYEHKLKDYHKALSIVGRALENLHIKSSLTPDFNYQTQKESLEHRRHRLRKKIKKSNRHHRH